MYLMIDVYMSKTGLYHLHELWIIDMEKKMMNQNNKVYWNLNDQMQHRLIEVQHRKVMEEYKY